jgi:catechol 2,3-dioxygenase-like lactoylglutathione lyase family enzyme
MTMTKPPRPNVECEQHHATLPVSDVVAAIEFYVQRLGFTQDFTYGEPPAFAGMSLDRVQIFLDGGTPSSGGASVFFMVGDADELHAFHRAGGVTVIVEPGDRDYGIRDYTILDLDGNRLTFGHRLPNREPALPIERVDVPVRLEKRLAAVLTDLANRKRVTVSECLEETLLHTFEPLGDGVASPHTKSELRYIQELKRKHGINYDCHANYRFVER